VVILLIYGEVASLPILYQVVQQVIIIQQSQ